MIEDSQIVKTIEVKKGGRSGTYWAVTWHNDKKDNIFNADWLPLLEQSQKDNRLLHYTKEENKSGYYNIVSLELATLPEKTTPSLVEEVVKLGDEVIPGVNARTRSMAIAYSKDLVVSGKIELKDMSTYADKFVKYILGIN